MDPNIHSQALAQVTAKAGCAAGAAGCSLEVPTEPYHPAYFMINGRSMPDDMDPNYALEYPHQPYNGNPHMHPGEQVLLRIIGQGRWQHPFHEHANHVRILARDGNLILSATDATQPRRTALFTTTTTPGQTMDGIFYYTGRGLNWDMYGHNPGSDRPERQAPLHAGCERLQHRRSDGDQLSTSGARTTTSRCRLLRSAMSRRRSGNSARSEHPHQRRLVSAAALISGRMRPSARPGRPAITPPSGTIANSPGSEAGFAFMWHSHNEREITTNNVFPGGMMMMMLVDSREFVIDESN